MARGAAAERWVFGLAYSGVVALLILGNLLPLKIVPGRLPGPDLMICFTLAWVLRRPQYVPLPVVALLFLLADMFFMRPLGLWAAIVVVTVEILRLREPAMREQTFPLEWGVVAGVLLTMIAANRLIQTVFLVDQVSLGLEFTQFIVTVLCYPIVVLLTWFVFGVTKMRPDQTDAMGRPR